MNTKKNSAYKVLQQSKSITKIMQQKLKKKKKIPRVLLTHAYTPSAPEPQPSTSGVQRRRSGGVAMPEREMKHVPCGNIEADKCFNWLISPVPAAEFYSVNWEMRPLHITNRSPQHYSSVFSCKEFDAILKNHHLEYQKNIDVVAYVNGQRETYNPDGRAYAPLIWDYFENGHSIRFLNPQTYSKSVWKLCSLLQEYFGSFVGCNMYLTPAGSQGFAPHYDDIEAFVLQIEGCKEWSVYPPRNVNEVQTRESSDNFTQDEIGDPMLVVVLYPGDMLYFPRGFIHQAKTLENSHSLHLTLSTYQKTTYGDLLQKALPQALEKAMKENVAFRDSLPLNYMNYMGQAHVDENPLEKEQFIQKVFSLTKNLVNYLQLDTAADMMTKDFIHSSHPPVFTRSEKLNSIHGSGAEWVDGNVGNATELKPYTEIRLIRKRAVCLLREEGELRLYHSLENSRVYQEKDPQYVAIDAIFSPAVEFLINSFPDYVTIEQLPLRNLSTQMELATLLYDKGLLCTKVPLSNSEDSDGD